MVYNNISLILISAAFLSTVSWVLYKINNPKRDQLPVLLYHNVSDNGYCDFFTITRSDLEAQFQFLRQQGYTSILLSELVNHVKYGNPLPAKPVLITFDDGYRDNYTVMYPLLIKYGLNANIFLGTAFLQSENSATVSAESAYLQLNDLFTMDPKIVEFGLNSNDHKNYKYPSSIKIAQDIAHSREFLTQNNIPFQECLAFASGVYPKQNPYKQRFFFKNLSANKIELAFHIGNQPNLMPLQQSLLIHRLSIRGNGSLKKFERMLK